MLGIDTGKPAIPAKETRLDFLSHYADVSQSRLVLLREKSEEWWQEAVKFFDVERPKSWIMLRRLTHSAHHRAQLVVYLRLLGRPVYSSEIFDPATTRTVRVASCKLPQDLSGVPH